MILRLVSQDPVRTRTMPIRVRCLMKSCVASSMSCEVSCDFRPLTSQSSAARASASAEALCWADTMFSGSASAAAIGRSTTILHECTPGSSRR